MSSTFHIPTPCHENWDTMNAAENGRHCAICNHSVVDFTEWEPAAIAAYLQASIQQRVCGRVRIFPAPIVDQPANPHLTIGQIRRSPLSTFQKIAAIIILVFATGTTACTKPDLAPPVIEEVIIEEASVTMGIMLLPYQYDSTTVVVDNSLVLDTIPQKQPPIK